MNFDNLVYSLRWKQKFSSQNAHSNGYSKTIPFDKNSCHLPQKTNEDLESRIHCFGNEVKSILVNETKKLRKSAYYRKINRQCHKTKEFLNDKNLNCIRSNKTNRFVICHSDKYDETNKQVLSDTETYLPLCRSRNDAIEKQANKLVKSCTKGSRLESEVERLMSTGGKPAKFFLL